MSSRLRQAETPYLRDGGMDFGVGDTVDVATRIPEGDKERIQVFNGVVIRRRGAGLSETFTVRRIVMGEGVERIFPVHSPRIASVKVLRRGEVRRSKLYYLRSRVGKATRLRESVDETGAPRTGTQPSQAASKGATGAGEAGAGKGASRGGERPAPAKPRAPAAKA
jgi:large subunit ribosomal protein L19